MESALQAQIIHSRTWCQINLALYWNQNHSQFCNNVNEKSCMSWLKFLSKLVGSLFIFPMHFCELFQVIFSSSNWLQSYMANPLILSLPFTIINLIINPVTDFQTWLFIGYYCVLEEKEWWDWKKRDCTTVVSIS